MVSPIIIVLAIIFVIIVAIIITGFFYLNRDRPPIALITDFGLTIRTPNQLYLSIENVNITNPATQDIIPVMTLKNLPNGQSAEPTEGWYLLRPSNNQQANIVTFFNPSNSGYIGYTLNSSGNVSNGVIPMNSITKPPDPIEGNPASFLGWFALEQNSVDNTTKFRSLYPGPVRSQDQYLITGTLGSLTLNPNVIPVTIGVPTNNNNLWIVG